MESNPGLMVLAMRAAFCMGSSMELAATRPVMVTSMSAMRSIVARFRAWGLQRGSVPGLGAPGPYEVGGKPSAIRPRNCCRARFLNVQPGVCILLERTRGGNTDTEVKW